MAENNESLGFWANVNDGSNRPTLTVAIETETGRVIRLVIRDRESLEQLAVIHVPVMAASSIGQALMLAGTMKQSEMALDK